MVITKVLTKNLPISQEFPFKVSVFLQIHFLENQNKSDEKVRLILRVVFVETFYVVINTQMTAYYMKRKTVIANKSLHNIK